MTEQALVALSHRGPDDHGLWQDGNVVVGHRRLSIIDLSASRQPMTDVSGRYVLAYNGEVYNYRELRQQLAGRWQFRTNGDTEVVLAGFITQGVQFASRMEGMWAVALWDKESRELLLSRDRMGKKPLYYDRSAGNMACASELPALQQLVRQKWQEDLDSTSDYLRYGYYLPGCTAYRGVHEVLPGHNVTWNAQGRFEQSSFWSLPVPEISHSRNTVRTKLRTALIDAVHKRLVADVEVGAFLSGGVDSSLIVSILVRELGIKPQTFTIGFQEPSYDERPFAAVVAQSLSTRHHEKCLEAWDPEVLKTLVLKHIGQPFADSSLLPTALVSQLASQHVKVALSGDGGDELFSGYQRYQARALLRWYTRLPPPLRRLTEKLVRSIPEPMAHHSHSLIKKAHLFCDVVERIESETPYVAPVSYSHRIFTQLAPELTGRGHRPPALPEQSRLDSIHEMMAGDALVYLPQDILVKVDRASMAHSLETRAPFLDSTVVALAFSVPRRWHRRGISGKRLLRETFADLIPPIIAKRRKQGFGVPIHDWFRGAVGNELEALLSKHDDTPIERSVVQTMLAEHRAHQRDHGNRLWSLYIYFLWREQRAWPAS